MAMQQPTEDMGMPSHLGELRKRVKHRAPLCRAEPEGASPQTKAGYSRPSLSPARPLQVLRGQPGPLQRPMPASFARRTLPGLSQPPPSQPEI